MRLLVLAPEYQGPGGGIVTVYRTLLPALRDLGVEIHVIEGSGMHAVPDPSPKDEDGILVDRLDYARLLRFHERFHAFAATPGLRRHLAAAWAMWEQAGWGRDHDVVEACDFGLSFLPAVIEGTRPLIVQCHGSLGQIAEHDPIAGGETEGILARLLERALLGEAQSVQTLSAANAAFWEAETKRTVSVLRPPLASRPVQVGPVGENGLVVGRVQRWKGPHVLCAALARMGAAAPRVDWFGSDTKWDRGDQDSSAYLATTFPEIWGPLVRSGAPIPPAEVARRQAAARFNLIPSTWDVFNLTAAEAMASGRPTIVSSGAGAVDLVEHGRNGYVFPAGDSPALADVLLEVVRRSPDDLAAIGRAGRETVTRALEPRDVARERLAVYEAAIRTFDPATAPVNGWLADITRPADAGPAASLPFLDQLPLRALLAHVGSRLRANLVGRSPFRSHLP